MNKAEDSPPTPTSRLSFLSIPLEIRLQIYSHLLTLSALPSYSEMMPSSRPLIHPSILLANRQINHEATPLLYQHNNFYVCGKDSELRLRTHMKPVTDPEARSRIIRFILLVRLDPWLPRWDEERMATRLSGAREVTLQLAVATALCHGHANLRVFEKVRGVGVVNVIGATRGYEDYITWLRKAMMSEPGTDVGEFVRDETETIRRPVLEKPTPIMNGIFT